MKVEIALNDKVNITAEGDNHLDVFKELASMQEVFGEEKCGKCNGTSLRFVVRHVIDGKKEFEYPELRCQNPKCFAKLSFGQSEGGKLFPVRFKREGGEYVKDASGKNVAKGVRGWTIFNKNTNTEE